MEQSVSRIRSEVSTGIEYVLVHYRRTLLYMGWVTNCWRSFLVFISMNGIQTYLQEEPISILDRVSRLPEHCEPPTKCVFPKRYVITTVVTFVERKELVSVNVWNLSGEKEIFRGVIPVCLLYELVEGHLTRRLEKQTKSEIYHIE